MTKPTRAQIAQHVTAGRCACCGHKVAVWTPEKIVDAFHAHVKKHGRVPTAVDWATGTADHPAQTTVCTMFDTWNNGVAAAGLQDRAKHERDPIWTRQMIVDALLDHVTREGSWPTWRDWAKAKGRRNRSRPASWSVVREFGTWKAAIEFASGKTDPRFTSSTVLADPFGCVGCGGELESSTPGCDRCRDRRLRRESRARAAETLSSAGRLAAVEPSPATSAPARGGDLLTNHSRREAA